METDREEHEQNQGDTMTKTYRYEFTIRSPEDVAFKLLVDLEQLEARYRNTYPVAVESASLRAFVIDTFNREQ